MFEVWDRVTGNMLDVYATREEAEAYLPAAYAQDFLILETEDDE